MNSEDIISKYLSKSATEEEMDMLLQWLEEKEENKRQFKETYDLWLYANASLTDDTEMEAALARLRERTSPAQKKERHASISRFYLIRIAASILLLFATGYAGYQAGNHREQPAIAMNHLLTGTDGKGRYLLPDSSIVWLNASSVLKYPETFTGGERKVYLEGEALFEVKKDKRHPFFVETGGLDIEVTGTRFLVNNYPQKNRIEAVLVNGSVKISGDYFTGTEARLLRPGELFTYNKQTKQTGLYKVDTDDYTNWIHPKLVFDKTNLAQVIINLQKWFDVEIVATPELVRNTHMSFTVRRESLEEVLTYMSLTAPVDYRWEDDILYLFQKK
ncbi:MAG: FecR domain-containing protein [Tannerellaceae bacterium]|jgi:ferric-dicitrate binding protein FerR (iron transport regulator)|nr:FecR domain-containing protein [Tannerellaceae bacterium]